MYFYRRPMWGIGFKVMMIILLLVGGSFLTRSAFQAGYLKGAEVEAGEIAAPIFYPHTKGFTHNPFGGTFLTYLAVFFGCILLIKLITSIVGLVMFNRWKSEDSPDNENWKAWKFHRFHHHGHCAPYPPGPWGPYPFSPMKKEGTEESGDENQPDQAE